MQPFNWQPKNRWLRMLVMNNVVDNETFSGNENTNAINNSITIIYHVNYRLTDFNIGGPIFNISGATFFVITERMVLFS